MSKPKRLKHIPGHKYRICRKCGYEYNVSKYDNWGKIYLCPECEKRRKSDEHKSNYGKAISNFKK